MKFKIHNVYPVDGGEDMLLYATLQFGDTAIEFCGGPHAQLRAEKVLHFHELMMDAFRWGKAFPRFYLWNEVENVSFQVTRQPQSSVFTIDLYRNDQFVESIEGAPMFLGIGGALYEPIIQHFIDKCDPIMADRWADRIQGRESNTSQFRIGDRVRTILGNGVKTCREGIIYLKDYHFKRESWHYKLLLGDRVHKTRYFDENLELID